MQIPTNAGMLANSVLPVTPTQAGLLSTVGETAGSASFAPIEAVTSVNLSREIPGQRAQPDFAPENNGQVDLTPAQGRGFANQGSGAGSDTSDSISSRSQATQGDEPQEGVTGDGRQSNQDRSEQSERSQRESDQVQRRQEQQQQQDLDIIRQLSQRDSEVRAHEQAHSSVGGQYAGSAQYSYQRGPDGVSYAVGGEVPIDVSAINGNPQATLQKMQIVQRAALAPAEPSSQDRRVAALAAQQAGQARAEIVSESRVTNSGSESEPSDDAKVSPDAVDTQLKSDSVQATPNSQDSVSVNDDIKSSQVFNNRIAKINEILLAVSQNDISSATGQLLDDVV